MSAVDAIRLDIKNYANFSGRSKRPEFWWWVLATGVVGFLLSFSRVLSDLFSLITLVPSFSVMVRRFHDVGKSGWWAISGIGVALISIVLAFIIGALIFVLFIVWFVIMIFWLVQPGVIGENQYGADPTVD